MVRGNSTTRDLRAAGTIFNFMGPAEGWLVVGVSGNFGRQDESLKLSEERGALLGERSFRQPGAKGSERKKTTRAGINGQASKHGKVSP